LRINIIVVPRVGLEPTTLSLEVSCSLHLSYRGKVEGQPTTFLQRSTGKAGFASKLNRAATFPYIKKH
jgi:hypothetical protein